MSDKIHEQISRLLDDDLPEQELDLLLRRLGQDAELQKQMSSYSMIGQALKNESLVALSPSALLSGIHDEIDSSNTSFGKRAVNRFLRPMVGSALAASVAAVAVMALYESPQTVEQPQIVAQPQVQLLPKQTIAGVTPVSASEFKSRESSNQKANDNLQWERMSPEMQQKLNQYASTHNGWAGGNVVTPAGNGAPIQNVGFETKE